MKNSRTLGQILSKTAFAFGLIGMPLWALSYVWILFRVLGRESEAVWDFVIAVEVGAMVAGLLSVLLGLLSRRYIRRVEADYLYARRAVMLGTIVWSCLVVFNLVGIVFL
jgi:hypothetical protein